MIGLTSVYKTRNNLLKHTKKHTPLIPLSRGEFLEEFSQEGSYKEIPHLKCPLHKYLSLSAYSGGAKKSPIHCSAFYLANETIS